MTTSLQSYVCERLAVSAMTTSLQSYVCERLAVIGKHFLDILKNSLQNFLKKCFFCTTCMVMYVAGSNFQGYDGVLPVAIGLTVEL